MKITSNADYKQALHTVYHLMNKGEENITDAEASQIKKMAKAIEAYEDNILKIMPLPITIHSIIQEKIIEMNLTQNQLAKMFGISKTKLSLILNAKRSPEVKFLKAMHKELGVDGNFLLETA
jgi:antitoxin component HigA of HigAB toxin-antitoxin module